MRRLRGGGPYLVTLSDLPGHRVMHGFGVVSEFVACGLPYTGAFFYENSSCGGSYLSISHNDGIAHFGTYGFTDKTSSIAIGCDISNVTVWKDGGYSGTSRTFGGADYYSTMPAGWNDVISSAKSDYSGVPHC